MGLRDQAFLVIQFAKGYLCHLSAQLSCYLPLDSAGSKKQGFEAETHQVIAKRHVKERSKLMLRLRFAFCLIFCARLLDTVPPCCFGAHHHLNLGALALAVRDKKKQPGNNTAGQTPQPTHSLDSA